MVGKGEKIQLRHVPRIHIRLIRRAVTIREGTVVVQTAEVNVIGNPGLRALTGVGGRNFLVIGPNNPSEGEAQPAHDAEDYTEVKKCLHVLVPFLRG